MSSLMHDTGAASVGRRSSRASVGTSFCEPAAAGAPTRLLLFDPSVAPRCKVVVPVTAERPSGRTHTVAPRSFRAIVRARTARVSGAGSKASTQPPGPTACAIATVNRPM